MKKKKNVPKCLKLMSGKDLLTHYRRTLRLALKMQGDLIAPTNNKHLKEERRVKKEVMRRLGELSVLVLSDYADNIRVIAPFFNEEERDQWLTNFWGNFREKFGREKMHEVSVEYQNINTDTQVLNPNSLVNMMRDNGAHIVVL